MFNNYDRWNERYKLENDGFTRTQNLQDLALWLENVI